MRKNIKLWGLMSVYLNITPLRDRAGEETAVDRPTSLSTRLRNLDFILKALGATRGFKE